MKLSLALQWRINRLKQLPKEQRADILYNWTISKSISIEQFKTIINSNVLTLNK